MALLLEAAATVSHRDWYAPEDAHVAFAHADPCGSDAHHPAGLRSACLLCLSPESTCHQEMRWRIRQGRLGLRRRPGLSGLADSPEDLGTITPRQLSNWRVAS